MLFTGLRLPLVASGLALCVSACMGVIDASEQAPPKAGDKVDSGGAGAPSSPNAAPAVAFRRPADSLQLLPFEVRLTKLATVLGVETEDAIFAELRAQRRELGAYDYAQGISPDLSWSAKRMAGWMKALRAVCDSPAMKRRYPTITGEVDELVMRAHGRRANENDRNDLASVSNGLDATARYRSMCMGFLASTEFLAP